ncbi:MAG: hypothetical protein VW338_14025 [Rhodospirillaceae bacterium]
MPLSATFVKAFGSPLVMRKPARSTATLTLKALPVILRQSAQWQ